MNPDLFSPNPVSGKTYSLFGNRNNTDYYYRQVAELVDWLVQQYGNPSQLLEQLRTASRRRSYRKPVLSLSGKSSFNNHHLRIIRERLAPFTSGVDDHLRSLSFFKRFDRVLRTSEKQYHLYMVEIELINRIHRETFRAAGRKLAFLPHCLRDLTRTCRSRIEGLDYRCRGCSRHCFINHITRFLKLHDVEAYIWMEADLPGLFKKLKSGERQAGILGIACLAELVKGMRLCTRHQLPVVGLPLNANRCARWMEAFHPNSINLKRLENLFCESTGKNK